MSTGVTEAVWHFAGYMHLMDEVARAWKLYEDEAPATPDDALFAGTAQASTAPPAEFVGSQSSPFWSGALAAPVKTPLLFVRNRVSTDVDRAPVLDQELELARFGRIDAAPPSWMISMDFRAQILREDAFGETVADIRQINLLHDGDVFVWGEDLASGLSEIDAAAALADLVEQAREAIPDALRVPHGQDAAMASVVARWEALAAGGAGEAPAGPLALGVTVNGEVMDADWERPEREDGSVIPELRNGHEAVGAHAHLGGNEAINVAVIQDMNELTLQTIVFGDWYKLNAVVQVNALMDVDSVVTFGAQLSAWAGALAGASGAGVTTGGNTLTNIAEFLHRDIDFGDFELPGRGGLRWKVDVLEGDFIDVKSIRQTNILSDGDVYSLTEYELFSQVRLGENIAVNWTEFLQLAGDYDLIVIGGNYYGANWIVQANILLDADAVLLGHAGGGAQQSVSAGGNTLVNDALISTFGGAGFVPLDADLAAFVQRLLTDSDMDPADWWEVNGIGSGSMRVLWVTGDYYDINLVEQTNIVADADQLAQILAEYARIGDEAPEQWVVTGENTLVNVAIIVDGESAVVTHVGGEVYAEDFLVQAQIVIDDDGADDGGLAPEIVAFTGDTGGGDTDDGPGFFVPLAGQGDMLGSVLT